MKLGNDYKIPAEVFIFLLFIGNQRMLKQEYEEAEKLFRQAYDRRNEISKENKKNHMFDLYYDWAKTKVGLLDISGAFDMVIEASVRK